MGKPVRITSLQSVIGGVFNNADIVHICDTQMVEYYRRMVGWIARLFPEEGYGFIRRADGNELYFNSDNLVNINFDQLQEGVEVKFIEEMAAEGPQAKRVSIGHHHIPL